MWLNSVQRVWKKLFHFRMFPMSLCSILDKEETHYVPLVVFCEALHLHQESIQWQTMQTAPPQFAGLLKEWLTRVAQCVIMFTIEIHRTWLIHDLRSLGNNDQNRKIHSSSLIILLPLKTPDSSWCLLSSTNFETDILNSQAVPCSEAHWGRAGVS